MLVELHHRKFPCATQDCWWADKDSPCSSSRHSEKMDNFVGPPSRWACPVSPALACRLTWGSGVTPMLHDATGKYPFRDLALPVGSAALCCPEGSGLWSMWQSSIRVNRASRRTGAFAHSLSETCLSPGPEKQPSRSPREPRDITMRATPKRGASMMGLQPVKQVE